jgi:hypothetical protein
VVAAKHIDLSSVFGLLVQSTEEVCAATLNAADVRLIADSAHGVGCLSTNGSARKSRFGIRVSCDMASQEIAVFALTPDLLEASARSGQSFYPIAHSTRPYATESRSHFIEAFQCLQHSRLDAEVHTVSPTCRFMGRRSDPSTARTATCIL